MIALYVSFSDLLNSLSSIYTCFEFVTNCLTCSASSWCGPIVSKIQRKHPHAKVILGDSMVMVVFSSGILPPSPRVGAMVVDVDLTRPKKYKSSLCKVDDLQLTPLAFVSSRKPKGNNVTFEDLKIAPSTGSVNKPF